MVTPSTPEINRRREIDEHGNLRPRVECVRVKAAGQSGFIVEKGLVFKHA
jgi:hypothetical protein